MTIARCITALLAVAMLGACASIARGGRTATASAPITAAEELSLLRLAERVETAAMAGAGAEQRSEDPLFARR